MKANRSFNSRSLAVSLGLTSLIVAGLVASTGPVHAFSFAPTGPEFQVHTTTVGSQDRPDVAMDANGNFIVVWFSATFSQATSGIFAQRFDSTGNPVGGEFRVNGAGSVGPSVAMAPDGRFVVAWDEGHAIVAKRYDAAGNALPPPAGVPTGSNWGLGNEFIVKGGLPFAPSGPSRFRAGVAIDANGIFVVAWEDLTGQDGSDRGIFAKRYTADGYEVPPPTGVPVGPVNEFQVNSFTTFTQTVPGVNMGPDGSFIITWWSYLQDGGFDAVMAKRYDSTGSELAPAPGTQGCGIGNEFQVNTFKQQWFTPAPGDDAQHPSGIGIDGDGNFVIAWNGSPGGGGTVGGQDCSSGGVFAKRYDASGNELTPPTGVQGNGVGNEFQVNSRGVGSQGVPDVAMTSEGNFVIAWYGYAGQPTARVIAKTYNAGGQVIPPPAGSQGNGLCNEFEATTFTAEGFPAIAIAPDGTFVIVWDDHTGADGDGSGIFARRYLGSGDPTPISPLANEPVLVCPADIAVTADEFGQALVPDLRPQVVITGVCAPCASVSITQTPVPGTLVGCGSHTITLTLSDSAGHISTCTTLFTVGCAAPPQIACSIATSQLWPPNHELVNVGFSGIVTAGSDPNPTVSVTVYSDEDDEAPTGDGNYSPDAENIASGTLRLRAERNGSGDGRVYLIVVTATDASGNIARCCQAVTVPKSQSQEDKDAVQAEAAAAAAYCAANGTPPPGHIDVGDGPIVGPKQ